jgi:hypothetical protein
VSTIRPFERDDLEQVAALYELVARSGSSTPAPGLGAYLQRVLCDQPWADPEIPSLVSTDEGGRIVGFQGSSVRRALFDGRPIRIGCGGQLVSHPDARRRAAGALLFRRYVRGKQDLTITDTASEPMRRIGLAVGMQMLHLGCIEWFRVLRPTTYARRLLRERRGRGPPGGRAGGARVLSAVDAGVTRAARVASPPAPSGASAQPLTPAAMLEHVSLMGDRVRLRLDYDRPYLDWLFAELARVTGLGRPIARLVRQPGARVLGWYVYYLLPQGSARVLQVAAPDRDVGRVLDHLLHDAWTGGAVAVQGRLEPRLVEPVARRRCITIYRGGALVHSRDREIVGAITSGDSLLTRLDSEWWLQDRAVDLIDRNPADRHRSTGHEARPVR